MRGARLGLNGRSCNGRPAIPSQDRARACRRWVPQRAWARIQCDSFDVQVTLKDFEDKTKETNCRIVGRASGTVHAAQKLETDHLS